MDESFIVPSGVEFKLNLSRAPAWGEQEKHSTFNIQRPTLKAGAGRSALGVEY
jgi:hypothetical protein